MDINTWNNVSKSEKKEIESFSNEFFKKVKESDSSDGFNFLNKYEVRSTNGTYSVFEKDSDLQFGNFKSKSKKVIDTLITNIGQNYGR